MSRAFQIAAYFDAIPNVGIFELVSEILSGIHRYVRGGGGLSLGPHPLESILVRAQDVDSWSGDGVIGFFYEDTLPKSLLSRGIAILNLTEHLAPLPVPVVVSDNLLIGKLAAAHLLERGHRRFGFLGFKDLPFSRQRRQGFLQELHRSGIPDSLFWTTALSDRSMSAEWFSEQIGKHTSPVGVFAADDDVCVRALAAAQQIGLRVPQDVALIGVNDLDLICNTAPVPLTSIAPQYGKIGFEAAALLERLLRGEDVHRTVVRIPPAGVVARLSSQFFAFSDPLIVQALTYMHANLSQPYKVHDLVRKCGRSRRTLEKRFRELVGRSLHEEMLRLRLERARQLLSDTDWTIERVAQSSGFGAGKRLHEAFARELGITPNSLRIKDLSVITQSDSEIA